MFLYLSKLLPLFIYPLGLACVLLLVAFIKLRKRSHLAARAIIALALIVLLLGSNGWVSLLLVRSLEFWYLPSESLPTAEAIVVLGGGIKPPLPPRPWIELGEAGDRVLYAARLYQQQKAPLIIVSGGRIDWRGNSKPEAVDMAAVLTWLGVPPSAVLQEPDSLNTYENAVNVRKILTACGIHQILLVTSAIHMLRARLVFQHQGINVIPAPTDFQVTANDLQDLSSTPQALVLNMLPDAERLQTLTKALKEYLGIMTYWFRGWL